jgi:hypothetical protein
MVNDFPLILKLPHKKYGYLEELQWLSPNYKFVIQKFRLKGKYCTNMAPKFFTAQNEEFLFL